MKPVIIRTEAGFSTARPVSAEIIKGLEAKVYELKLKDRGFDLLEIADKRPTPKIIYGKTLGKRVKHLTKTYTEVSKKGPFNIRLVGAPGSGKSVLADSYSNALIKRNIPVVVVRELTPPAVLREIAEALTRVVFILEEVDSLYTQVTDNGYIPLLDDLVEFLGDQSLKGMSCILLSNSASKDPESFVNRPGRFHVRIPDFTMSSDEREALVDRIPDDSEHAELKRALSNSPMEFNALDSLIDTILGSKGKDELCMAVDMHNSPNFINDIRVYLSQEDSKRYSIQYSRTSLLVVEIKVRDKEDNSEKTIFVDTASMEGIYQAIKELRELIDSVHIASDRFASLSETMNDIDKGRVRYPFIQPDMSHAQPEQAPRTQYTMKPRSRQTAVSFNDPSGAAGLY